MNRILKIAMDVHSTNYNCTKVAARRLAKVLTSDLFFFEKQW